MINLQLNNNTFNNFFSVQLTHTIGALPRFGFFRIEGELDIDDSDCSITVGDSVYFNGKITSTEKERTDSQITTMISTADNTYNAYESDCKPQEFENATIKQIAENILSPFGLKVKVVENPIIDTWATFPTDNVYSNLDLLAGRNGFIVTSNGLGEVYFFRELNNNNIIKKDDWPKFYHFKTTTDKRVTIYHQDKASTTVSKIVGDISRNYILPIGANAELLLRDKEMVINSMQEKIEITFNGNRFFDFLIGETLSIEGILGSFFVFKKDLLYNHHSGYTTNLCLKGIK